MAPGSSSRISKQLILSASLVCLPGILTTPSASQRTTQKTATKHVQAASAATPTPEVPDQVDKVAEVQIKSAVKVLQEGRPGVVFVIVRNISNVPVAITNVDVTIDGKESSQDTSKDSIKATITGLTPEQMVLPQHAQKLKLDLSARQIEEGTHLLLVQVDLKWDKNNKPLTGSLFASYDFSVEVLALSGVLSVLGASSILFLPGFLAVTVFFVLNRLWGKLWQGEKWQLDWKSPEFWMAALTVSLVAPYIYRQVSRWWLGETRDYLKGYGLSDIVLIWFASISISIGCWGIYRIIRESIVRWIENKRQRLANYGESLELEQDDRPNELLDKLARRWEWDGLSLFKKLRIISNPAAPVNPDERKLSTFPQEYPQHVGIRVDGLDESYFLVGPIPKQAVQILVVPPIEYAYIEPKGARQPPYEAFRQELDAEMKRNPSNVGRIAALFTQGSVNAWLDVNWGKLTSGNEKAPRFVRPGQLIYRPDLRVPFFQAGQTK